MVQIVVFQRLQGACVGEAQIFVLGSIQGINPRDPVLVKGSALEKLRQQHHTSTGETVLRRIGGGEITSVNEERTGRADVGSEEVSLE